MSYIKGARTKPDKIDQSKKIRELVYFNSTVVTPLVGRCRLTLSNPR
jgi:hypothetical protein